MLRLAAFFSQTWTDRSVIRSWERWCLTLHVFLPRLRLIYSKEPPYIHNNTLSLTFGGGGVILTLGIWHKESQVSFVLMTCCICGCWPLTGMEMNFFDHLALWLVNSKIYQYILKFTSHFYIKALMCTEQYKLKRKQASQQLQARRRRQCRSERAANRTKRRTLYKPVCGNCEESGGNLTVTSDHNGSLFVFVLDQLVYSLFDSYYFLIIY